MTKLTPNERAVLAAVFARTNMGQPKPEPAAVARALNPGRPIGDRYATSYVVAFCGEYMETDEHQDMFEDEAKGWWKEFGKHGQDTREYVNRTWPDMGKLFGWM